MLKAQTIGTAFTVLGLATSLWSVFPATSSALTVDNTTSDPAIEASPSDWLAQYPVSGSSAYLGQAGLTVTGTGYVTAPADRAFLQIFFYSTSTAEYDPTKPAEPLSTSDLQFVVNLLTREGIAAENINLYLDPNSYGSARVQVEIAQPTTEQMSRIVTNVNEAIVADGQFLPGGTSVIYTVDQCSAVENEARRAAMADAQSRAADLATVAEVETGALISISEYFTWNYGYSTSCPNSDHSATFLSQYGGYPFDPTVTPSVNVTSQITATYAID